MGARAWRRGSPRGRAQRLLGPEGPRDHPLLPDGRRPGRLRHGRGPLLGHQARRPDPGRHPRDPPRPSPERVGRHLQDPPGRQPQHPHRLLRHRRELRRVHGQPDRGRRLPARTRADLRHPRLPAWRRVVRDRRGRQASLAADHGPDRVRVPAGEDRRRGLPGRAPAHGAGDDPRRGRPDHPVPLDKWAADSRGWGIDVTAVVQDLAQLRTTWGPDRAKTIYGNLPTKVVLPGVAGKDDLEELAYLAGRRRVQKLSHGESVQDGGGRLGRRSVSTTRHTTVEPVISGETIYGLPPWHAYVLGLARRAVVVKFEPGHKRARRVQRQLKQPTDDQPHDPSCHRSTTPEPPHDHRTRRRTSQLAGWP
ncbi:TraM recognition domain-containing protein [Pseudonocardia sulfidoxydans]|uniref:TraM recognition domain-containing protein n=1 Tax=Pseudonocardia sulfidoxydans TaxID=54011 RepID=UPI0036189F4E